jgi:hypothetical protein
VSGAFLSADHFPLFDLNPGRDGIGLAEMRSWEFLFIQDFAQRNVVLSKSKLFQISLCTFISVVINPGELVV